MHSAPVEGPITPPIPDQTPYVQAGMAYLGTLYDLKDLFSTFDLDVLDVSDGLHCVLAQAQTHELGGGSSSYYDFLRSHIIPEQDQADMGFAIHTSLSVPTAIDIETACQLNAAWKSAIKKVLAE